MSQPLPWYATLDVGGTSIKIGAVRDGEVVIRPSVPARAQAASNIVLGQLRLAATEAVACATELGGAPPSGLAIAFPGPFDLEWATPMIRGLGKFDAIYGIDLRRELSDLIEPVFVRDSEAIGVGEARFGAGQGSDRVLTCALGTGFGSCLTVDGRPQTLAGSQVVIERLHELDTPDGRADDVLSASGLARLLDVPPAELGLLLTSEANDPAVDGGVAAFATRIGRFLSMLPFDVDLIVIAGGLAASFDRFADGIAAQLDIPVVPAQLGTGGALLGAAELAFSDRQAAS